METAQLTYTIWRIQSIIYSSAQSCFLLAYLINKVLIIEVTGIGLRYVKHYSTGRKITTQKLSWNSREILNINRCQMFLSNTDEYGNWCIRKLLRSLISNKNTVFHSPLTSRVPPSPFSHTHQTFLSWFFKREATFPFVLVLNSKLKLFKLIRSLFKSNN